MKTILFSTVLFFSLTASFAQLLPVSLSNRQPQFSAETKNPFRFTSTSDTIDVYVLRATGGTFYQSQDGGYIFGTSYYYDGSSGLYFPVTDETGIGFDGIGNATVTDILFWAGAKQITGNADNITGKIYSAGSDSMPVTLLGSGTMSMQDVDTSLSVPVFTDLAITSGSANISSSFFASIAYAGNDDTLGLVSTAAGDGMMEKRIRMKATALFGGAWIRMGELYPFLDVDLFLAPVVTLTGVGVDNHFSLAGAQVSAVYPTAAKKDVHLDYQLAENAKVSYEFFDLRGRIYYSQQPELQQPGNHSQAFDVSGLAAGNYFLRLNINGKSITQKVVVGN